ncbi:replication terminator protein [Clostridium cochlearium]|uniref:Replication terminator protein, phage associated n=1 Tax=Clostridium cochlearium TaxID=1494 RepID=A0A2X2Y615_CLOCO|nr:replication terminator protein [Clostridium cochlearium]SQB33419.1 replication terminator protein, phage associated [Clostridium cochlearium]
MSKKMINLETFANGALAERMDQALKEVLENIADPNTDFKPKRKLTLEMKFTTSEDRELTEVEITAKTKLAPKSSVSTKIIIDRTLEGEVLGTEFKKQLPGQQVLKVDGETGEVMEENKEDLSGLQVIK